MVDGDVDKLSHSRNSAGRRSLRRSRSFKVIDFDTNRKPVSDFLLTNNINLHRMSHRLPDIVLYWSNYCFWQGDASPTNSFLEISENITISHILLKAKFFGLSFLQTVCFYLQLRWRNWPNSCWICCVRITQNKDHYAIQGHSRSSISVPI